MCAIDVRIIGLYLRCITPSTLAIPPFYSSYMCNVVAYLIIASCTLCKIDLLDVVSKTESIAPGFIHEIQWSANVIMDQLPRL